MNPTTYDPNFCTMAWPDGDWLWFQSRSYCAPSSTSNSSNSLDCTWDLAQDWHNTRTRIAIPLSFKSKQTYTCDNQLHDLQWENVGAEQPRPNRYICGCGEALSNTTNCAGRCDRPWVADFTRKCNMVTDVVRKGNFSTYGGTEGTCLRGAGYRRPDFSLAENAVDVKTADLRSSDLIVADGFALTHLCSGDNADRGNGRICNCDGALPKTAFGRTVANRDACGIDSAKKAWIAAPVIGGVGLLVIIGLLVFGRRRASTRRKRRSSLPMQLEGDMELADLAARRGHMQTGSATAAAGTSRLGLLHPTSSAVSQSSHESTDSGVSLLPAPARVKLSSTTQHQQSL